MTPAPKLRECPFCGKQPKTRSRHNGFALLIFCDGCVMSPSTGERDADNSVAAWNYRAPRPDALRDELRGWLNDRIGDCRFDILEGRGDAGPIEVRWRTYEKVLEWLDREGGR